MEKWYYNGVADITIGEVHENKTPKIVLAILLAVITISGIFAIIFRNYIHDMFVTPEIILKVNEVSVALNSEFDAEAYIINKDILNIDNHSITGDIVDTSILNAEYTVIYTVWNRVNSSTSELKVKIVDDTAPIITIKSNNSKIKLDENNSFTLIVGKSTSTTIGTDDFDIHRDILVEVSDNHTSEDALLKTLKIIPDKLDLTLNESEFSKNIIVYFRVTDESGLISESRILITIVRGTVEIPQQNNSSTSSSTTESSSTSSTTTSTPPQSTSSTTSSKPPASTNTTQSSSSSKPPQSSSKPQSSSSSTTSKQPTPSGAYIHGVHDVTVKTGTGLQTIVDKLLEGVYGSGYITVEYRRVNPTIAGVYTVTFTSSDGIVKTCTVTVKDEL